MRVVGVIAEYNPFHLGHAHQLEQARKLANADAVVVVMSSVFTQRGDAAILSPMDRSLMALYSGADAVFALPAAWAVRDAEHFALGGVALLAGLGCDAISFGTEHTDISKLQRIASILENPDDEFRSYLQAKLDSGIPHPAALSAVMETLYPDCAALLDAPNSTLAICYLRALLRLGSRMDIVPVLRAGSYHATELNKALPSATALRGAILRGDWSNVRKAMPEKAFNVLLTAAENGRIHRPDALDPALLYRLRTMSGEDYSAFPDLSEGIENRLGTAAKTARSREELLQAAKTRRYPYARLSRMATHALLGFTDSFLADAPLPSAAWLLGFRRDTGGLFTHFKAHGTLPLIGKAADFDRSAPWYQAELLAYDIWTLGAGLPAGLALTQGVSAI